MIRQTSVDAYRKIKDEGLLSKRRFEVYDLLYEYGPLTSSELFEKYKKVHRPAFKYNMNVHSRLNELREQNAATEVGTKPCSVSGNNVILWDVTDKIPTKFQRKESDVNRYKALLRWICEENRELVPMITAKAKELDLL